MTAIGEMSIVKWNLALILALFLLVCGCSRADVAQEKEGGDSAATGIPPVSTDGATAIELTYQPEGYPMELSVSQGFLGHLFDTPGQGQGFGKMPPDAGFKRHYDEFRIAGATHLLISEESRPPRFYFDENRNGDLTDDRGPFAAEKEQFLPNNVSIQIRYDREKVVVPYRMWVFGSNMGGVRFYPVCHWKGVLEAGGGRFTMLAFDANADGDYSNDPLVIDANDNGTADQGESLTPGQSLQVAGQEVRLVSLSPSGLTVWLKY
jgi:hypothetical protein